MIDQFSGYITALVTPFTDNNKVDHNILEKLIERQIKHGINGIVPIGTTGEWPTLSNDEAKEVVKTCVDTAKDRIPVIANIGTNNTQETINMAQWAQNINVDALLIVTPYYNKPTQCGLYAHYEAVHNSTDLPIIIYNIPGRSVVDMHVDTMVELTKLPRILGVKDATADLERPLLIKQKAKSNFYQLSGEDSTVVAFLSHGGHGCISVISNVFPDLCTQMYNYWQEENYALAYALRDRLFVISKAMFCETNPVPIKYALSLINQCRPDVRLPLVKLQQSSIDIINDVMCNYVEKK